MGYGRWEELQKEVRSSWAFKFDWFIKTRDQAELARRVEMLAKLVERQVHLPRRRPPAGAGAGARCMCAARACSCVCACRRVAGTAADGRGGRRGAEG